MFKYLTFSHCLDFLQFVFKTTAYKERTIHEELVKNMTGLLQSNDSTTVKHVLKVKNLKMGFHWDGLHSTLKMIGFIDFYRSFLLWFLV